ncbi:MAG: N-acetylmuramoyl-L-alanine amidase [Bacillota bacterium]|nr:N-acetylmuramoyl-L-alanine amidase [Bacillota bacterium]MDW7684534.1 N-acetylmuramoyl-L-alanine amidase [Bacillota bacterium]
MVMLSPAAEKRIRSFFVLLFLLFLIGIAVRLVGSTIRPASVLGLPLSGRTFVIDPGHGGYDPGVTKDGLDEKDVTLAISLMLRDYLQSAGAHVVLTRETDRDFLIMPTAGPKKKLDMKNRLTLIREAEPDMFLSIHANAMNSSRWRGAQVFYRSDSEDSRMLAELVQQELIRVLTNTDRQIKTGDYLLLNELEVPAIIVEVGFLSNWEEKRLLSEDKYRSKLAWAMYLGIMRYYAHDINAGS